MDIHHDDGAEKRDHPSLRTMFADGARTDCIPAPGARRRCVRAPFASIAHPACVLPDSMAASPKLPQRTGEIVMARQVDAHALKQKLARARNEPINCAVVSDGHEAHLLVDKVRSPRKLQDELVKELESEGFKCVRKYFGTVHADEYPGVLVVALNKPAAGLAKLLTFALRGTGYRKVTIIGNEDGEDA